MHLPLIAAVLLSAALAGCQQPSGGPAAEDGLGRCVPPTYVIFDNTNADAVHPNGTSPSFTVPNLDPVCLISIQTYHWNGGAGMPPGSVGYTDTFGNSPMLPAVGSPGQGGVPNANWKATANQTYVLRGPITITDSDPISWSQNVGSKREGFAIVEVQKYLEG